MFENRWGCDDFGRRYDSNDEIDDPILRYYVEGLAIRTNFHGLPVKINDPDGVVEDNDEDIPDDILIKLEVCGLFLVIV